MATSTTITSTGEIADGDARDIFGPNTTWGGILYVGGNGTTGITRTTAIASVATTDGNLHIDAGTSKALYLNYYSGTSGIIIGNGASAQVATISGAGAGAFSSLTAGQVTSNGPLVFDARNAINGITGAGNTADTFTQDTNKVLNHYGLSWKAFSDATAGPSAALSGYGGVRFYTNGTERVRIDAAGFVGIGGTPTKSLELFITQSGYTHTDGVFRIQNASATGQTPLDFIINGTLRSRIRSDYAGNTTYVTNGGAHVFYTGGDSGVGTERVRLDSTGNVGIGTASPTAGGGYTPKLHLYGPNAALVVQGSGGSNYQIGTAGTSGGWLSIFDNTANAERMRIDSTGNVGIGGTPVAKLGVVTTNPGVYSANGAWSSGYVAIGPNAGSASGAALGFGYDTTNDIANIFSLAPGLAWKPLNINANDIRFNCAGTERLVLTTDGRVYGKALHNNGGAVTGTTNQYIASGTYTPTLANIANTSGLAANNTSSWMRVGNIVTVHGMVSGSVSTANIATQYSVSLPIASTLGPASNGQASGIATESGSWANYGNISANSSTVSVSFTRGAIGSFVHHFFFQYLIL